MYWRWFKRTAAQLPMIVDPWRFAGTSYVGDFRNQLDEVARKLSNSGWRQVKTSFNPGFRCAELDDADKGVIARIVVNGEMCAPNEAIVKTDLPLEVRKFFSELLPVQVTFQRLTAW